MFTKILIANRGEIACRIIKTARRMGIQTVAVYSDADVNALHVNNADEAIHIGPSASNESYLLIDRIIAAAKKTGTQAIHPGYGFLSENTRFSKACKDNDIIFIGPDEKAIDIMGSKSASKKMMSKAGVPLLPGYHGTDQSIETLQKEAADIGYPVMLKASAGGGGKGMRQVWSEPDFAEALAAAKREASNAFGDDVMLVEKYLTKPRHVEIQVFCDQHGNAVYLAERDCSVQRRHQKVIEEAPAPELSEPLRKAMGEAAIRAAKSVDYIGAGTVEFLLSTDNNSASKNTNQPFYFMEMNTRLQVEHTVTEMITGLDLVEWQLRVAWGEQLPLSQDQITLNGHAFEARIYAEDPNNGFLPATGKLVYLQTPEENQHVRVDTGVVQGDTVSMYYDPMIAKLVVWDVSRDKALNRLARALRDYHIQGVTTNLDFLHNLATITAFQKMELDTGFIDNNLDALIASPDAETQGHKLLVATLYQLLTQQAISLNQHDANSPWNNTDCWRMNAEASQNIHLNVNNETHEITVKHRDKPGEYTAYLNNTAVDISACIIDNRLTAIIDGHRQTIPFSVHDGLCQLYTQEGLISCQTNPESFSEAEAEHSTGTLIAPMNGKITKLSSQPGTFVSKGETLLVMEAMKIELNIKAPSNGTVIEHFFAAGDIVAGGIELLNFVPDSDSGEATEVAK
ncbi:MAG: acetyl/propionyl/methylcrotonyl-CoA carboxylase subunit alpha [Arenicella sp.]